jgi:hypothetical protein
VVSATVYSAIESWRDCAVVILYEQSRDVLTHYYETAIHEFEPAAASYLVLRQIFFVLYCCCDYLVDCPS